MIDLDHDAVTVTRCRPADDAIGDRNDLVTELAREIDAGVVRGLARERVRSLAEIRRNPACIDGPPLRVHTVLEVLIHEHALEHAELRLSIVELLPERLHGFDNVGNADIRSSGNRFFRTTQSRRRIEVELAVFEIRHPGQPAAQCIQANDAGIHLCNTYGECVECVFIALANGGDAVLLQLQFSRQILDFAHADTRTREVRVKESAGKTGYGKNGSTSSDEPRGRQA